MFMLFFLVFFLCLKINQKQASIRKHEKNLLALKCYHMRIKKSTSAEMFLKSHVENIYPSSVNTGVIS